MRMPTEGKNSSYGDKVREIKNMAKMDAYLVNYADGDARDQTRLVFTDPNRKGATFVLKQIVQGTGVLVPATGWFEKALKNALDHEDSGDADLKSV
jgi:hypothetical protein